MMKTTEIDFWSGGQVCRGWRAATDHDELAGACGRPAVVMAHGVGGTADTGLQYFAEKLCDIGVDVLAFDYRGFGLSAGSPRQAVSMRQSV